LAEVFCFTKASEGLKSAHGQFRANNLFCGLPEKAQKGSPKRHEIGDFGKDLISVAWSQNLNR